MPNGSLKDNVFHIQRATATQIARMIQKGIMRHRTVPEGGSSITLHSTFITNIRKHCRYTVLSMQDTTDHTKGSHRSCISKIV